MKQLNFLSKSSSLSCGHNVVTLASTVGSPSAHRRGTMLKLLSVLVLILALGVGNAWGADQTVTWTINGVNNATSSGGQNVNTTLKTSSKSPTSETGVWTAVASSSYASSNSGAQFGSSGYTFAGTITLSGTSIPSTATIKSVTLRCTTNGTAYKVNASVSNNTFGSQVTLNSSSATNYTFTGSQVLGTGGNIVLTFSSGGKKNFVVKSLSVTYEEAPSYTINAQSNNTSKGTVSLSGTTITATPKSGYRISTNEPYAIAPANSATVTQDGNTFTVTPSANTTITINFEEIPTHTVTWSANGNTSNTSVVAEGSAIDFPESASGCTGKTFMGWTSTPIVGETDDEPTYVTSANMGTSNITYYAVFADADEGGGTIDVTDLITASSLAATGTTYTVFSGVNGTNSDAVYAGKSSKNGSDVQLNATSPNGIVSTASGGKVKSVVIVWSSNATDSRTVDIYGNHTAYSTAADLYSTSTDGDKVGSIVYTSKTNNATTYTFTSDYEYVGIRMNSNATRMVSISITWKASGGTTYSNYTTSCCTPLGSINGSVSLTQKSATLSWDLTNAQNGGKDHITSWKVEYKKDGGNWTTAESTLAVGTLTKTINNLDCNSDYSFRVSANVEDGYCADAYEVSGKTTQFTITLTGSGTVSGGTFTVKGQSAASVSACDDDNIAIVATRSTGYNFSGWTIAKTEGTVSPAAATASTSFTMPAENVTVTAAFAAQHHNVVFHKNDGGEDETDTQDFTFGVAQKLKAIETIGWTRTNYVFGGWMTASNGSSADYDDEYSYTLNTEDNVNLYALWVANNTRTISYSGDTYITSYSSKPTTVDIENDDEFSVSFTLNSHYKLTGVSVTMGGAALAANLISFTQSSLTVTAPDGGFTDNLSVTFTTAEIKHTVTFHAGTGSCATESLTQASYGAAIELPSATISAQGWSFVGWAEASVASATSVEPTLYTESFTPAADDDLYAVYRKTITEGGTSQVKFTYPLDGINWTTTGEATSSSYYLLEKDEYVESPEIPDLAAISSIKVSVAKYGGKGAYTIKTGSTLIATGGIPTSTSSTDITYAKADFANTISGTGRIRLTNTDGVLQSNSQPSGTRVYGITINIDVAAVYSYHSTPASATGLAVQVAPTKTVYKVGDTFDPAGTTLRVIYSNSTTEDITSGFTYSPTTALTKENTSVTFSYLGLNCNQAISVLDPVATPTFSPASGSEVSVSETITISCETASATIYYTTDGSDPTNTSAVYSTPIAPYSTIKAIAMKADMAPSEIATATYTVVKNSQTLSFTNSSYSFRLNSDEYNAFEHQAVSGAQTTVTYSSSKTSVADVENGVIVLKGGKGTATITATAAETATYSSASATYTITVLREGATRTGDFVLVTDANDLENGDYIVLASNGTSYANVFSGITSSAGTSQSKNVANDEITYAQFLTDGNTAKIITLEKSGDYWMFNYGEESDVYIAAGTGTGSGDAALRGLTEIDDYCKWSIAIADNEASATNKGNTTYYALSFNGTAVKSYKQKQSGGLRIYKQLDRNLTPQTLSFETASYEFPLNESGYTSFTHQVVSGAQTAVTYSSNNTDVAAIVNNEVVLQGGVGTATITATAAEDETYKRASATYTITVTAALNTVTFHYYKAADATADQTALKEESSGAGITVPAKPTNVGEYTFLGWAPATLVETQTAPNNLVAALQAGATYHPTNDEDYYAIYRRLENSDGRFYLMHNNNYAKAPASSTSTNFQNTTTIGEAAVFEITEDNKLFYYEGNTPRYFSSLSTETGSAGRVLIFYDNAAEAAAWTITESGTTTTFYSSTSEKYLMHNNTMWAAYATANNDMSKDLTKVYLAHVYYSSTPNLMVSPVLTWAQGNATHVMEIEETYDNAATATVSGEPVSVSYTSSDPSKATVSNAGVVTAITGGLVTITATVAENPGVSRELVETYQVSITKKVPQIVFDNEANWKVYVGEAYKRVLAGQVTITTDGAVTYTLSNNATSSDWASINSETGEVTGLSTGGQSSKFQNFYVHTAETDMYQSGEAYKQFNVLALKNQTLTFGQNAYVFDMNESVDAFTNTLSGNQTAVAYGSDNTDVAEVDEASGEVTVHTNVCGVATITATAAEGYSGTDVYNQATQTYTITVNYPMPTFSMESSNIKAPVSLAISGYDENTKLYYTDGEGDPATLYSEPLAISATKTIRAKATNADGSLVSPIASVTLTKVTPTVTGTQNGGTITLSSDENSLITYIIENGNHVIVASGEDVPAPVVFETEMSDTYNVVAYATWDVEGGFGGSEYEHDFVVKAKGHLPIHYEGNGSGLADEAWATKVGYVGNYNSGDLLIKFDGSEQALIAAFVEKPVQLSYGIKHMAASNNAWETTSNVYSVQWSADGETYNDIVVYNASHPMSKDEITSETFDLDPSARYIKWIYNTKTQTTGGNVALGNIRITCEAVVIDGVSVVDIPEDYDGDVIVEEGVTWVPVNNSYMPEVNNLWVKQGAIVDLDMAMLEVNDLRIEAMEGYSGQIREQDNFSITGNAYYDLTLNTSGTMDNSKWYAFAVPFHVDAATGIQRLSNDGVASYAGFNSHYVLLQYDRSLHNTSSNGWKYVTAGETLEPGKFYMVALNSNAYNRLRMTKKADAPLNNKANITLEYTGGELSDSWNAVANNALAYVQVSAEGGNASLKVQTYNSIDDNYTAFDFSDVTLTVGTPFFIQAAVANDPLVVSVAASTAGTTVKAPQREAVATEEFQIRLGADTESYYDILYVSASEDAENKYQIGHDLAKAGVSTTVPQMYVPAYGAKLCDAEFPLVNNEATFPLTFTAPNAGTYQLYVAKAAADADLYLLRNGNIIWNLSMSAYELTLEQGTTTEYGLLLQAKAPNTATGVDSVQPSEVSIQKVIIDEHVYILRGEQMYDVTGKMVR